MAKDPYRYFRIEAGELLGQLAKGALDLEKDVTSSEPVMRLLRLAHTLKGAARVVKQAEIADLSHTLEGVLTPYRTGEASVPRTDVDQVLGIVDAMTTKLSQLPQADAIETGQATGTVGAIEARSVAAPAVTAGATAVTHDMAVRIVRADVAEVDVLLEGLGEIGSEMASVRRDVAVIERIGELASRFASPQNWSPIRLRMLAEEIQKLASTTERTMSAAISRVERELHEARDAAERLRLVPISSVFNMLERTARDAAHAVGKQVVFEARGGTVRIDGEVLDAVQGALVQLVRNAVAHGIETAAQRQAAGKPPAGRVTLEVARRGYRVWFRCADDGRGVDLEAVRRTAEKTGAANTRTDTGKMDAAALLALLLKGGISTSSVVTEISGRGIGLDVVREAMHNLRGEVSASTTAGVGTAIELSVPLSLAALEVLIVESGERVAALPLDAVQRTLRVVPQDIVHSPSGDAIIFEGRQIPFIPLRIGTPPKNLHTYATLSSRPLTAVVLGADNVFAAVAIDRLRGIDTVVLQRLPSLAPADPIVLGVHLDSDGVPQMVLDPDELVAMQYHADRHAVVPRAPQGNLLPILIVDDSLTTRMLECSILESAGFTVAMAASAEEGLEMAHRRAYALFLVDVDMPGMDGFGFVTEIRADPLLCKVPCILVTSRNAPEDVQRGLTSGANAYIVKGEFDQVGFLEKVNTLVQQ